MVEPLVGPRKRSPKSPGATASTSTGTTGGFAVAKPGAIPTGGGATGTVDAAARGVDTTGFGGRVYRHSPESTGSDEDDEQGKEQYGADPRI